MKRLNYLVLVCCWVVARVTVAHAQSSPFDPLSVVEQRVAFETVIARFTADAQLPHDALHYPLVVLAEPPKASVLALQAGRTLPRRAEVQVMHHPSNRAWSVLVDLASKRVLQLTAIQGQPALTGEEYAATELLVRAYEPWQRALQRRGLDPKLAYLDIWAGNETMVQRPAMQQASFGAATRLVHVLTFMKRGVKDVVENPYVRPVEGIVVTLDLNARRALELIDHGVRPVSSDTGNAVTSRALKPLTVQQPAGSELTVQGHFVRYRNWQFYAVMRPREGLVLYDVRFDDHGRLRRIAYRLALSEIYVPYGIGDENWAFRHAFDVGEYNAGMSAQRLERGLDVPDNAQLFDATFYSDTGPTPANPDGKVELPQSLALFERSAGLLWTRTDPTTRKRDSRPAHELVATWSCWLGNYVYQLEWIFKLDGSMEVRAHLHGTTLNRGMTKEPEASAPRIGKDARGVFVAAPHHQHFLNYRLDLDVDGTANQLMEMEIAPATDPQFKNAFDTRMQYLTQEGYRDVSPASARHWHVESLSIKNALGKPTSYALEPESLAYPHSAPDFVGLQHAAFAQHALWFTRYREGELYAGGAFPFQAQAGDGVNAYVAPAEALRGGDLVLWYTMGFTHVARAEDWPVMPGETVAFRVIPRGFFGGNPGLEVGGP